MLDKTFDAASAEPRIYDSWETSGAFKAGAGAQPGADSFCIVIPPPNVTGSLHMGHALNNTLQDILIRRARMQGRDVLWQPGTDHAGIATQMVVERQMMERQEPDRRTIGREAFLEKVWDWKRESGDRISNQLRRLGASCDWSRERFTMDDGLSHAVLKVFVDLHKQGLIYRDKRLVNWDPKLMTAISDLEVVQIETKGHLWHFRYPVEGDGDRSIIVATTRPETMLGDTGVAVHPDDPRYQDLIGHHVVLPLVGRRIPIVADPYADPETGSGAVKITPAHDFNDFDVGKRQSLRVINVFGPEADLDLQENEDFLEGAVAGSDLDAVLALHGQDRFFARKAIVDMMEAHGLLVEVEDHTHMVPHGDRGNVPIEPYLTDQWYVDAKTLAGPAIDSVRQGRTNFVPQNWERTYYDWMENIEPWCISRQLWWGHQIPAWYGPDGTIFVEMAEDRALEAASDHYGTACAIVSKADALAAWQSGDAAKPLLYREEDVLDTWFSSALWPFSTLGWPEETPELKRYYQTDVLVTAFDIIFFWVARMMMSGLHFMKEEPFHTVYIHALVRDEKGAKMSKSKGNVIDPLDLCDEFGADALRFTLAAMAAQGRDIKLAKSRVAGYRNFGTKLWNATRFCEMNQCVRVPGFDPSACKEPVNRWIVYEARKAVIGVSAGLDEYKFNEAAAAIYQFVWNTFCDWYLELIKPVLNGTDEAAKAETRATAAWAIDQMLMLLHPFMPFVTEELWTETGKVGPARDTMLVHAAWPDAVLTDDPAADEMGWLVDLISTIRSVRSEMNVPAAATIPLVMIKPGETTSLRLERHAAAIMRLARIDRIDTAELPPQGSAQIVLGPDVACLPLAGVIDFDAERQRLEKELNKLDKDIQKIDAKLGNDNFLSRAPEEVVEEQKERREEALSKKSKVADALSRLASAA
ncbi:MAG: valine--tRNA ligase [Pseudomonadota bacterium]